jgi:hypothetical protein
VTKVATSHGGAHSKRVVVGSYPRVAATNVGQYAVKDSDRITLVSPKVNHQTLVSRRARERPDRRLEGCEG